MASPAHPPSVIRFGSFELDAAHGTLRKGGVSLKMHPQPFRVLLLLAECPGQIVTRKQIHHCLWSDNTFVDFEGGINFCVKQIRAALGDDAEKPRYIETLPRRGYRFIASVNKEFLPEPAAAPVSPAVMALPRPSLGELGRGVQDGADLRVVARQAARAPLPLWKRKRMLVIACFFTLFSLAGTAFWLTKRHPSSPLGLAEQKQLQLTANSSENAVTGGAISADGKYLAYADAKGIHIKLIETGETRDIPQPEILKGMQVNWSIVTSWARNGTRVIATANAPGHLPSIWAVPIMGGAPRKLRDDASAWSVSRDGSWVAFTTNLGRVGQRELWMMTPEGEHARKLYEADENTAFGGVEWSPDGQRVAYLRHHEEVGNVELSIESRDLRGGPAAAAIPTWVWDFSWSPDGRLIYSLDGPGPIGESCNFWGVRLDERTGKAVEEPKRLTQWAGFCVDSPSITADGKRLAFRKWSWGGRVYVADLETSGARIAAPRRLTLNEGRNYPAAWTPDSKAVIFGSYRDSQWSLFKQVLGADKPETIATLADSKSLSPYGLDDVWSAGARVSPDGAWLLYFTAPQEIGSASPFLAPARLMRVPITGGAAELVLTARTWHRPACARAPARMCVIGEQSPDRKQLIFTAFDPTKGRTSELTRFEIDPATRYPNDYFWDLSPDGTSIAILRRSEPSIHLLFLRRPASRVIVAEGWNNFQSVNWAADGKGLLVSTTTKEGAALLHIDLGGNAHVLWEQKGILEATTAGLDAPWGLPSPDGRHLAIYEGSLSGNMWMMENF